MVENRVEVLWREEDKEMREIDHDFAHWPVRYATSHCMEYDPPGNEENDFLLVHGIHPLHLALCMCSLDAR
jgi:hypothetical protein